MATEMEMVTGGDERLLTKADLPGAIEKGKATAKGPLDYVKSITESVEADKEASALLSIGAGLPHVPQKLVNKIQAGEFIKIVELLLDRLGVNIGME